MSNAGILKKDIGLIFHQFQQTGVHSTAVEGFYQTASEAISVQNQDKDITVVFDAVIHPKKS